MGEVPRGGVILGALIAALIAIAPADAGPEPLADFVVASITVDPPLAPPRDLVYVTVTIRNDGGTCWGCQPISFDFYKHRVDPPFRNLTGDWTCLVNPPLPGATISCTHSVSYPVTGTYSMWAQADTYHNVSEADETNNILGPQELIVVDPPAFFVESIDITPDSPQQYEPASAVVTIANGGATCSLCGPVAVDFYAGLVNSPGETLPGDFACSLPTPASHERAQCQGYVTYTSHGTFQMWAQVNRDEKVFERNFSDNVFGPQQIFVRQDTDADGLENSADNCPFWPNPSQEPPDWSVPPGDSDCDGHSDAREEYLGTDPMQQCPADTAANNEFPDAWPPDVNDNRLVNTIDVGQFVFSLNSRNNQTPPDPRWNQRHDLNGNGTINTIDVGTYVFVLNKTCSPSGP